MKLDWVDDLLVLLDERNFSSAATRRFISQPALSRRIQSLERWLGVTLIDRTTKPVGFLVPEEQLKIEFQSLRDQIFDLRSGLRDASQASEIVRVGAQQALTITAFPDMSRSLKDVASGASFRIRSANREECVAMFLRHEIDILICYETDQLTAKIPFDYGKRIDFGTETLIPACKSSGAKKRQPLPNPIPLLLYPPSSFLGMVVRDSCLRELVQNRAVDTICESAFSSGLKEMVMENMGIAWLPRRLIRSELENKNLIDFGDTLGRADLRVTLFWNLNSRSHLSSEVAQAIENMSAR